MNDKQWQTHKWLNKAYTIIKGELAAKLEAKEKAFAALSCGSKGFDSIDVQQTKKNSQEERQHLYEDLVRECDELKEAIALTKRDRIEKINLLESSIQRAILIDRYINQRSFDFIAKKHGYSVRQAQRIRLQGLDELNQYINLED